MTSIEPPAPAGPYWQIVLERFWEPTHHLTKDLCSGETVAVGTVDLTGLVWVGMISEWLGGDDSVVLATPPEMHPFLHREDVVRGCPPSVIPAVLHHHQHGSIAQLAQMYKAIGDEGAWGVGKTGEVTLRFRYRPLVEHVVVEHAVVGDASVASPYPNPRITAGGFGVVKCAQFTLRERPAWLEKRLSLGRSMES